jgi:hypothetical protein
MTPGEPRNRRLMSLGERRVPGTNQSNNEDYLSNHPVSNLASYWKNPKDSQSSIDAAPLNKTGVLLP